MDQSMRLVEKHCAKYLDMFGQCIQQFPYTWHMDCESERIKLAKCAETNPEIVHIKSACGRQFYMYETCMKENQAHQDKCSTLFEMFTVCADEALKTFPHEVSLVAPTSFQPSSPVPSATDTGASPASSTSSTSSTSTSSSSSLPEDSNPESQRKSS